MQINDQIAGIKKALESKLLILGHYYQDDEVLQHADAVGDSLELARRAAQEKTAERIVFCGVHFMAESADLLTSSRQAVYMPDPDAGCPMAGMAPAGLLRKRWDELQAVAGDWVPVIYVNSSAAAKAFCGARGGCTCTSSNAARVVQYEMDQGRRVFFIPDEHLARNTARALNLPDNAVAVFDRNKPLGGLSDNAIRSARMLAWRGFCPVHAFTEAEIMAVRRKYPGARVIVHPETPLPAASLADARGSTSQIIKYVESLPDGAVVAIGTEMHLVNRLARQFQHRLKIVHLHAASCRDMSLTTPAKLLRTLQSWPEENIIRVPDELRENARLSLQRMLDIS